MEVIIKNGVLKKGAYIYHPADEFVDDVIYIPQGVRRIDRNAFPWEKFIRLDDECTLRYNIGIWFTLPGGRAAHFFGHSLTREELEEIHAHDVQKRSDCYLRHYFRTNTVWRTDDNHSDFQKTVPDFDQWLKRRQKYFAHDLCNAVNYLVNEARHSRQETEEHYKELRFFCEAENGYFYDEYMNYLALHGLFLEPGCHAYAGNHIDSVIRKLPFRITIGQIDILRNLCRTDLIPETEIDRLIEFSIQHTQKTGNAEAQILLTEYKHQHFGEDNPGTKFSLD